ncbi:hypothetical protein ACP70R_022976 [Stipagrostis hirtigluma subsp. patula]
MSSSMGTIAVHAPLLEQLNLSTNALLKRIDIMTPLLKKLKLSSSGGLESEFSLSFSAPVVEKLSLCFSANAWFGEIWLLENMKLKTENPHELKQLGNGKENTCLQPQHCPRGNVLSLYIAIGSRDIWIHRVWSMKQQLSQFLAVGYSNLELKITRLGHVYGAMVMHVLEVSKFIQKLKVEMCKVNEEEACPINCTCDQPNNWRSQSISLTCLKEIEIQGFRGET